MPIETVEEFFARGGRINKVAADTRTPEDRRADEKAMRLAVRGERVFGSEQALIDERHIVVDHLGDTRVRNGLGEWIA